MRWYRSLLGTALSLALLASGCARNGSPAAPGSSPSPVATQAEFPVTVTDDDGVSMTLQAPPQRIVTFAPSDTEILFALGLGDRIVGVSGPYDNYPAAAKGIAEVGGAGDFGVDPNIEAVVSLQPDLFLTISGGEQWKKRLRDLGVPVFTTNATDLGDLLHDIGTIGRITGAAAAAAKLTAGMRRQADAIQQAVGSEPRVSCFFETYYSPLYTVGPGSFIYDLLERAGCDPVTSSATDANPQWSVESLVKEDPQVYLVSSNPGVGVEAVAKRPGFDAIAAVADGHVIVIDSDLVNRSGPRIVEGLRMLAEALHPNVFG